MKKLKVTKKLIETLDVIEDSLPHSEDELPIIQYLRSNGQKRMMFAPIGRDYVEKAKGLELSAEWLPTGKVALYGKRKDESDEKEICELADNGSGENEPVVVLRRLIDRLKNEKGATKTTGSACP